MTQTSSEAKAIELASALEFARKLKNTFPLSFFEPYGWQREFYEAGRDYPQRMLLAANRVGKSKSVGVEVAYHATGEYPDWWKGRRFDHPPLIWALGVSGEQIRDVIQDLLFGSYERGVVTGGLIRRDQVVDVVPALGVSRLAKDVVVKHKLGQSTISLKSYSQGQHVLMGSSVDLAWIDEEPQDPKIYPQVLIRTATGDKNRGGMVVITETPELGVTEIVRQYMDERGPAQYLMNVTWDDAPHLDEKTKRDILDALPAYQHEMRSKGIPVLGEGRIFTVTEERIVCDPFPIPEHYFRCAAIDFGIDHPTACVWVAEDRDSGIVYVTDTYRQRGEVPAVHAAAINARGSVPMVYPHDGDNTEKGSGYTLAQIYRTSGLPLDNKFTNEDGTNYVEPGILDLTTRMREGRLQVFSHCSQWLDEYRRYHRKNGKIVKLDDDLLDATRYAVGMVGRIGDQDGMKHRSINVPRHLRGQARPIHAGRWSSKRYEHDGS